MGLPVRLNLPNGEISPASRPDHASTKRHHLMSLYMDLSMRNVAANVSIRGIAAHAYLLSEHLINGVTVFWQTGAQDSSQAALKSQLHATLAGRACHATSTHVKAQLHATGCRATAGPGMLIVASNRAMIGLLDGEWKEDTLLLSGEGSQHNERCRRDGVTVGSPAARWLAQMMSHTKQTREVVGTTPITRARDRGSEAACSCAALAISAS